MDAGEGAMDEEVPVDGGVGPACAPFQLNGETELKADLLLIPKGYGSDNVMRQDFSYFMDFDSDNRGLFGVYPFNVTSGRFNIWVYNGSRRIGDWQDPREGRGLVKDGRVALEQCPFVDYSAVLAKEGMGRGAFTLPGHRMFVKDVHRKVLNDRGAAGLIHEWGHAFGQLQDESQRSGGESEPSRPNCARSREQAERWWGDLAENYSDVSYYRGCKGDPGLWEPHDSTIMGDGGLWRYGRVNDRRLLERLSQYS